MTTTLGGIHNKLKEVCAARDPANSRARLDPCRCMEWSSHRAEGTPHRCGGHLGHEWGGAQKSQPAPEPPVSSGVMRQVELLEAAMRRMRA